MSQNVSNRRYTAPAGLLDALERCLVACEVSPTSPSVEELSRAFTLLKDNNRIPAVQSFEERTIDERKAIVFHVKKPRDSATTLRIMDPPLAAALLLHVSFFGSIDIHVPVDKTSKDLFYLKLHLRDAQDTSADSPRSKPYAHRLAVDARVTENALLNTDYHDIRRSKLGRFLKPSKEYMPNETRKEAIEASCYHAKERGKAGEDVRLLALLTRAYDLLDAQYPVGGNGG